jgi:4-nitrophenyl phosphatase
VVLATNNATATVEQYLEKVRSFGVDLESWQVVNSSQAAARYLARLYPQGGNVFVIGEEGLVQTLQRSGFTHDARGAHAVVVGMDRQITYQKLLQATLLIRSGGAHFIATNTDRTFPIPEGLAPGAGALVAALEASTDVQATVVGKPSPEMYLAALERLGAAPQETLVVGDRLETDIAGGQTIGCPTVLVLSGVTSEEAGKAWKPPPDLILPDLASLVELAENKRMQANPR